MPKMIDDVIRRIAGVPVTKARDGETISVQVGLELSTGKVGMVFGKSIKEIRLAPAKAREVGVALIKAADALAAKAEITR